MRWFRHFTDSHTQEDLKTLQSEFGAEGFGVWWILLELIGQEVNKKGQTTKSMPLKEWARSCRVSPGKFLGIVQLMAKLSNISIKKSGKLLTINCPKLLEIRDEYTDKQLHKIGIISRHNRETTETEAEKKTAAAECAAVNFPVLKTWRLSDDEIATLQKLPDLEGRIEYTLSQNPKSPGRYILALPPGEVFPSKAAAEREEKKRRDHEAAVRAQKAKEEKAQREAARQRDKILDARYLELTGEEKAKVDELARQKLPIPMRIGIRMVLEEQFGKAEQMEGKK